MRQSQRLITSALANVISPLATLAAGLLIPPFVISRIGDTSYGLVVVIFSILQFAGLVQLGTPQALNRFVASERARGDQLQLSRVLSTGWAILWGAAALVTLLVAILVGAPQLLINLPEEIPLGTVRLAILIMGLSASVQIPLSIGQVSFYATGRFGLLNGIQVGGTLVRLSLIFALIPLFPGVTSYVACNTLAVLFSAILVFAFSLQLLPEGRLSFRLVDYTTMRKLMGYGTEIFLGNLAFLLYLQADYLLIGRTIDTAAVTMFSLAVVWSQAVRGMVGAAVQVALPFAATKDAMGDAEGLRILLQRITKYAITAAIPPTVFLIVFRERLVATWMGPGYEEVAQLMIPLLLADFLVIGSLAGRQVFLGIGSIRFFTLTDVVLGPLNVLLALLLSTHFGMGIWGFAVAYLAVFVLRSGVLFPAFMARTLGLSVARYFLHGYVRPIVAGGILFAVVHSIDGALPEGGWGMLLGMAAAVSVIYLPLAYLVVMDEYDRAVAYDLAATFFGSGRRNTP